MTDISGIELLPCPFCGSAEHLTVSTVGSLTADMPKRPYRVECHHVEHDTVGGPTDYGRAYAIAAWNRRHPPASREDGLREAADNAMNAYVDALVKREHGGIAASIFLAEIAVALGRNPTEEMDAKRRALLSQEKANG